MKIFTSKWTKRQTKEPMYKFKFKFGIKKMKIIICKTNMII